MMPMAKKCVVLEWDCGKPLSQVKESRVRRPFGLFDQMSVVLIFLNLTF